ncbi:MAG: hypothetical protein M3Z22_01645 [Verrucomicrobiota bacterium]|nr:hypothetical protein [Verrucomicrobiota bacterium]
MRVLFTAVVALHVPSGLANETLSFPTGFARLVDLHFLQDPFVFAGGLHVLWAALVLYAAGVGWWFALPYMTLFSIAVGSVQNSSGAIGHHAQIVSLVLLAQTAAYFYSRFRFATNRSAKPAMESRLIDWSQQAIAATYFISGLTKLIHTRGLWIVQSRFVAVQIVKTSDHDYYDALNPASHGAGYALADWMVRHPLLVAAAMSCGLLLEVTSPLLLLGRGWAAFYGVALLIFHESIERIMKLHFANNEMLLVVYLINVPFWIGVAAQRLRYSTVRPAEVGDS